MKLFICFLILFISNNCLSQQNDSAGANKLQVAVFGGGKLGSTRLSPKELKTVLYSIPAAVPYYKKSATRKTIGFSLLAPAVGFALLGRERTGTYGNDQSNRKTVFLITSAAFSATAVYFIASGFNQLKKSVQVYNNGQLVVY